MSLIGFWPLNGDLKDYSGNSNDLSYVSNSGKLVIDNNGKMGSKCYQRLLPDDGLDLLRSKRKIFLNNDFTMSCWAYVTGAIQTANALITNHNHVLNSGAGINVKIISDSDYRITCNTGDGTNRTVSTYYGTTNIKDKWCHLLIKFIKSTNTLSLWVNGIKEYEVNYAMYSTQEYFEVFAWSTMYDDDLHYRAAAKLNDIRVYNHALSTKEIKELAKAKVLHYTFDQRKEYTKNLMPNNTMTIYTNYSVPATLVETGEVFKGQPVYRLTMTVDDAHSSALPHFQSTLDSHGVYVTPYVVYRANMKYAASIYWKSVNKPDVVFGGNASNIPGWSILGNTSYSSQWNRYTQIRDGSDTVDRSDNIFFSFYCPSLALNEAISIDLCCVQLEDSVDYPTEYVKPLGTRKDIVRDCSGFRNDGILALGSSPKWIKGKIGKGAYQFDGANDLILMNNTVSIPANECFTISLWVKPNLRPNGNMAIGYANYTINKTYIFILNSDTGDTGYNIIRLVDGVEKTICDINYKHDDGLTWLHVVYKVINGICYPYINGVAYPSSNYGTHSGFKFNTVGAAYSGIYYAKCGIDDVRIYTTALQEEDILALYKNIGSIDEDGNLFIGNIVEKDYYFNNIEDMPDQFRNITVYAKAYPTDGTAIPYSGIYVNNIIFYRYGRDWHISVWDTLTNAWATGINFYGASNDGTNSVYDVYGETNSGGTITGQKQAFINTLKALTSRYIVIIAGSHAPEFFDNAMVEQIKRCGGSGSKLKWAGIKRSSYICIGRVGCGEGNAYSEVLDNLDQSKNIGVSWAKTSLNFTGLAPSVKSNYLNSNISEKGIGLVDDLMGWWPLNGNTKDYSPYGRKGLIYGNPTVVDGKPGSKAYSFDGIDDSIRIESTAFYRSGNDELTVSCWAKLGRLGGSYQVLVSNRSSAGAYNWLLYQHITDGSLQLHGASQNKSIYIPPLNQWIHIVATVDKFGDYIMYVNSDAVHYVPGFTYWASAEIPVPTRLNIGDWGGECVMGSMQDVRVYNRALSAAEVAILYKTTSGIVKDTIRFSNDSIYVDGEINEI